MSQNPDDLCNRAERICAIAVEPFMDVSVFSDQTLYAMRKVCEPLLYALSPDVPLELFLEQHHTVQSALNLTLTRKA